MLMDEYRAPESVVSRQVPDHPANCDSDCEFDIMA